MWKSFADESRNYSCNWERGNTRSCQHMESVDEDSMMQSFCIATRPFTSFLQAFTLSVGGIPAWRDPLHQLIEVDKSGASDRSSYTGCDSLMITKYYFSIVVNTCNKCILHVWSLPLEVLGSLPCVAEWVPSGNNLHSFCIFWLFTRFSLSIDSERRYPETS